MTSIRNMLRAAALGLAIVAAAAIPTKKAHADGGAVIAGVAGGLILGSIIGSTANANHGYYAQPSYAQPYYAPQTYYAPRPYYAPPAYYAPPVTLSFGYSGGHRYRGHRRHYRRHHRGHRRHYRGHRRHHRRYGY